MNEKQLLEGLNYIEDDLLAESVNVAAKPNKVLRFPFKRLVAIAACLCLIMAIAVPAGFALGIFRGNYKPHDDGYHLIRQDIDNTYYIELPSATNVTEPIKSVLTKEKIKLTYQHTVPGNNTHWDMYTDEQGNEYTYHEVTGQLVSIVFQNKNANSHETAAITQDMVVAFSEAYLQDLVPSFSKYELAEYIADSANQSNATLMKANAYTVHYGVPIGEYFFGDQVIMHYSHGGDINSITFPQNAPPMLEAKQIQKLNDALPSKAQLHTLAVEHVQAQHMDAEAEKISVENAIIVQGLSGYELRCAVEYYYCPEGAAIATAHLLEFTVPLN